MIRIEIEASSVPDLYHKISGLLEAYRPIDNTGDYLEPAGSKIITGLKDAVDHAQGLPSSVEYAPRAALGPENQTEGAEVAAPRRGRPRKNAQPAVAENTGSLLASRDASGSTAVVTTLSAPPPAAVVTEQASTSVAGEAVPAAAPVTPSISGGVAPSYTAEQVRAKLQEFLATPGGDRGLQLAGDVLGQFGLAKVKQVNDNPQHFAGIVAAVDAELAKLAVAK